LVLTPVLSFKGEGVLYFLSKEQKTGMILFKQKLKRKIRNFQNHFQIGQEKKYYKILFKKLLELVEINFFL
jgi:hypothetical protein